MTTTGTIRQLLNQVDLPDPHAFAEAFIGHVQRARTRQAPPLAIPAAVQQWLTTGCLDR